MKISSFQRNLFLIALLTLVGGFLIWWKWPPAENIKTDWTEFRGPTQDGHSSATGLPVEWSAEKNIVWRTELPGRAWSSPIVAGNRIYLTNATTGKDDDDLHAPVSLRVCV